MTSAEVPAPVGTFGSVATQFRFSAEAADALGISAADGPDAIGRRLGFPAGVKVSSAKADGDGLVLTLGGLEAGEVTGAFSILTDGRVFFEGFRPVEPAEESPPTQEG